MISIRSFLVVVLLAAITLINFLAVLQGYRTSMAESEQLFDDQLDDIAAVLESGLAERPVPVADATVTFQVWRGDTLESASAGAPHTPIVPLEEGYSEANFGGYRWRTFSRHVPADGRWLIVAERTDIRSQLAESVILESVMPAIATLPLAGIIVWIVVGRGLLPLNDLATAMARRESDDLSEVKLERVPRELEVLIASFNGLLRRLDASFQREKRFAADAAHELRTPISALKVHIHNIIGDYDETGRVDGETLRELQAGVGRLEHTVEQLLLLYRTKPEQFAARFEVLNLATVARDVIAELYPRIEQAGQTIELAGEGARLRGDNFALRTLLANLIDNASKYAGRGARIRVRVVRIDDAVMLSVEDDGPGITAEARNRVFERFYREDDRHDNAVAGSGLGLAIARHVAEIHGAGIDVRESSFASGLRVDVNFPVSAVTA